MNQFNDTPPSPRDRAKPRQSDADNHDMMASPFINTGGPCGAVAPPRATSNARRHAAFTLIELLIVLTILAIAAMLIAPAFGQTGTTQLRQAARLLEADLAYAQVESISHPDDPRVIVFDPSANSYHLASVSSPSQPITNPATNAHYNVQFGQGRATQLTDVTIESLSVGGDQQLAFGQYGELDQDTPATIRIECKGQHVTLTIDPTTGEVTVGEVQ